MIKEFKDRIASQCLLKIRNPLIIFQKEMCQWIFLLPYRKLLEEKKTSTNKEKGIRLSQIEIRH